MNLHHYLKSSQQSFMHAFWSLYNTTTILTRVANGSLLFCDVLGEVDPPHLVMPITIEPTKSRMCHDERFLNLWLKTFRSALTISPTYRDMLGRVISRLYACDDMQERLWPRFPAPSSRTLFAWSFMEWLLFCIYHSPLWLESERFRVPLHRSARYTSHMHPFPWCPLYSIHRRSPHRTTCDTQLVSLVWLTESWGGRLYCYLNSDFTGIYIALTQIPPYPCTVRSILEISVWLPT